MAYFEIVQYSDECQNIGDVNHFVLLLLIGQFFFFISAEVAQLLSFSRQNVFDLIQRGK